MSSMAAGARDRLCFVVRAAGPQPRSLRAYPENPSVDFRTFIVMSNDPETLGHPPQHHL